MSDKTENLSPDDKIKRLLTTARTLILSERDKRSTRVTEIQTGQLRSDVDVREYESTLEELNRYQYCAEMLEMLVRYLG